MAGRTPRTRCSAARGTFLASLCCTAPAACSPLYARSRAPGTKRVTRVSVPNCTARQSRTVPRIAHSVAAPACTASCPPCAALPVLLVPPRTALVVPRPVAFVPRNCSACTAHLYLVSAENALEVRGVEVQASALAPLDEVPHLVPGVRGSRGGGTRVGTSIGGRIGRRVGRRVGRRR
eukprot:1176798-Rhodomonas_salina.1